MDYKFKSVEYYKSLKHIAMDTDIEGKWFIYRVPKYVGLNMYLAKKYKPKDEEDFFNQYINDVNKKDSFNHGRSINMLYDVATQWKNSVVKEYSLELFMDLIILHVIVETYNGYLPEMEIIQWLENKGYEIFDPDENFKNNEDYKLGQFDSKYSIDIIAKKDGEIKHLIQCKPVSTFISTNVKTKKDRDSFGEHNKNGIQYLIDHGEKVSDSIQVLYMLYLKNNKWATKNKIHYYFTLNELLNNENIINSLREIDSICRK